MNPIRIIAGELKGRAIPFSNKKYDNADISPQKVKGAIFSMIGERLQGHAFLDLFAGSGQIGIEALSRGADPVVLNEPDGRRYHFIKSFLEGLKPAWQPVLLNLEYQKALGYMGSHGIMVDHIFLDPPYSKIKEGVPIYRQIIEEIAASGILHEKGKIIVQHFSGNVLDDEIDRFRLVTMKKYGKTSLAVYACRM